MDRQWKIITDHETDEWVVLRADWILVEDGVLKLMNYMPDDKELSEVVAAYRVWSSVRPQEPPITFAEQGKEPMP